MALKIYTSKAKGSKLNVRKFFVEVTGEKLVEGSFLLSPHPE